MTFYVEVSYGEREECLLASEAVCRALDLPRVPEQSTLAGTYQKLRRIDFETLKGGLLGALGLDEEGSASDTTGFSPGQASAYDPTRSGRSCREFINGA